MIVTIDPARCLGNGLCESIARDVFEVSEDGRGRVLVGRPADDRRAAIDDAVRMCPTQAIALQG